jgi:hypothetical protein
MGSSRSRALHLGRHLARGLTAAAVLAIARATTLAAQRPESTTLEIKQVPDFSGFWQIINGDYVPGHGFNAREACAAIKDPSGGPMIRCSQPWEAKGGAPFGLKDFLNKRALAWMDFRDEQMSEKHLCIPNVLPAINDKYIGSVFQLGAGEIHLDYPNDAFTEGVRRTIWMDGRKHPGPHERFFHGHSIGWYEGNDLVVETANFTFDPDGLEDHIHVPSSAAKVVTERWHRLSPTRMDVTYTVEDKLFLKKPWVFTWHYEKVDPPLPRNQVNFICDPEISWDEARIAAPSRYTEDDK